MVQVKYILGLLSLFQVLQREEFLGFALKLTREMIGLFWDEKEDGFLLNGKDSEKMILANKETYDGAFSSSNTIAAHNLMKLSRMTQDSEVNQYAQKQFKFMSGLAKSNLTAFTGFMSYFDDFLYPSREIVLVKDREKKFLSLLNKSFVPDSIYLYPNPLIPWTENYRQSAKGPTIFVCENFACKKPLHTIEELKEIL